MQSEANDLFEHCRTETRESGETVRGDHGAELISLAVAVSQPQDSYIPPLNISSTFLLLSNFMLCIFPIL